jgi:hypothetical protein
MKALMAPFPGIAKDCYAITRWRFPGPLALEHAFMHYVLCEIRRRPLTAYREINSKRVHGQILVPEGFALATLQGDVGFEPLKVDSLVLSRSHDSFKAAGAIIQISYGCITLYRTRGLQIEQYRYAAYGLTVVLLSSCPCSI